MATHWQSRDVAITLPTETVRAMWERARRYFDVTEGARFDPRSATPMLLWSSRLDAAGAEPIGAFTVRWDTPTPDEATVHQVAWVPRRGGTEAQGWLGGRGGGGPGGGSGGGGGGGPGRRGRVGRGGARGAGRRSERAAPRAVRAA